MGYQPTAEGRAGNCNAALDLSAQRVRAAIDSGLTEKILSSFADYVVTERIVKTEGQVGRVLANSARQGIYDYMRENGFDVDSLIA